MSDQRTPNYPPVAIGCCFYQREPNYQEIISSIEKMAMDYDGKVAVFIYFSGEIERYKNDQINKMEFECPWIFTIQAGPNRIDEPKYKLPLISGFPFIFTVDDDCIFEADTLTILMDSYNHIQALYPKTGYFAPIGWFGTVIKDGKLITPIEGRYHMEPREIQQVDYVGSCGCLYRREILADIRLNFKNWPNYIGTASDVWLSYLIDRYYNKKMYITGLKKRDLPEHGHSLWEDSISNNLSGLVDKLVANGWKT